MSETTAPTSPSQFDAKAQGWDDDPRKVLVATTIAKAMLAALNLSADDVVLDYGAGTGLVSLELAAAAGKVVAAEPSEGMYAALCAKVAGRGVHNVLPVRWTAQDATPLPERPTAITGAMVLHHVEDVPQAARVFADLLPSGAPVAFADLDLDGGAFHGPDQHAFHQGFDRDWLRQVFEQAGFAAIAFSEVMRVRKPTADGSEGVFPIFLMTGRKA